MRMNVERVEPSMGVFFSAGFLSCGVLGSPGLPERSLSLPERCPRPPFLHQTRRQTDQRRRRQKKEDEEKSGRVRSGAVPLGW